MKTLDDLIVRAARAIIGGVMAVGTALVYVQFIALMFILAMIGTTAFAAILAAIKAALIGG